MISRLLPAFAVMLGLASAAEPSAKFDIQSALDALPSIGGIVRLPAGTYEITAPLRIEGGDVQLEGAGAATHIVNRATDRQPAVLVRHKDYPKNPRDRKTRLWRVTVANLRVTGTKDSGDGINAEGVD